MAPELGPGLQTLEGKNTEGSEGMFSKLSSDLQGSNTGIISAYLLCVNVCVYHQPRSGEPGAKPVYTLGLQSGGNGFRLDVVESSRERPAPCESTLKGFIGHLVALWSVWISE